MSFSVLIVAQHTSLRQSLGDWLSMDLPGIQIAQVASSTEALRVIEHFEVEVLVVDIHEPWGEGLEAVRLIHAAAPRIPLIALGLDETEAHWERALSAGAVAYVCKSTLQKDLIPAMQRALEVNPVAK